MGTVAELLEELSNPMGFDALKPGPTEEQAKALGLMADKGYALAQDFRKTFTTPEGKRVLRHLREMTIENSTWCASLGLKKGAAHGFAREGQNALVRYMEDQTKLAETLKVQKQKDKENVSKSTK